MSDHPRILLIVAGGIAAYKSLELVRLLRRQGIAVRAVMTESAKQFVTPLSLGVMTEDHVYGAMFDLMEERAIGHIQLSRDADLIVVCPATANIMAKMAAGIADDLATTVLLATDTPVLAVPAMNVRMWEHPATLRNIATLTGDGITVMDPDEGGMACGEYGPGRLPEPPAIVARICAMLDRPLDAALLDRAAPPPPRPLDDQPDFAGEAHRPLFGKRVLVTAGPTHEPIDPVRYIANRSSGKQGFAIAAAAADLGAEVTLVAGPVALDTPPGVARIDVETARDMAAAVEDALPADIALMVAAVADWRAADAKPGKIKKDGALPAPLALAENPDILAMLATHEQRPGLLVGFAAETDDLLANAAAKLDRKGCDWIVANDVSGDVMGGDANTVHIVTAQGIESWPAADKATVARRLMEKIAHDIAPDDHPLG